MNQKKDLTGNREADADKETTNKTYSTSQLI